MHPLFLRSPQKTYEGRVLDLAPIACWPFTDVSGSTAEEISGNNRDGSYTAGTLASSSIKGRPVWTADGSTNSHINLYSAALNTAWPRTPTTAGTILIWAGFTGSWTEAAERYIYRFYQDGNNKVCLSKITANKMSMQTYIGGVNTDLGWRTKTSQGTDPMCIGVSWDSVAGKTKWYLNGSLFYSQSGALIWGAGNLSPSTTLCGRSGTSGANLWPGPIGYCAIFDKALTDIQVASISGANLQEPVRYTDGFTIIHNGDTSQTSNGWASSRWESKSMSQWVVDNASKYNIKGIVYSGDCVETEATAAEWDAVAAAADILGATEIPYHYCAGNHDYSNQATRTKANFDSKFPQSRYTGHAWFNGAFYEANKSENAYWYWIDDGQVYMIMSLEIAPRAAVVTWANDILTANSSAKVIIFTHQYMNDDAARYAPEGNDIWNNILKLHDNIILVCCGHDSDVYNSSYRVDNSNGGKPIHQLYYNGHDMYPHIRLFTIRPAAGKIEVQTYDPTRQCLWSDSQMTLSLVLP